MRNATRSVFVVLSAPGRRWLKSSVQTKCPSGPLCRNTLARSTLRLLRQAWRMASPGLWKTYSVTLQKACRGLLDRCASGDLLGAKTALAGSYPRRAVYHEERSRIELATA